jgi:hypothetical protein
LIDKKLKFMFDVNQVVDEQNYIAMELGHVIIVH